MKKQICAALGLCLLLAGCAGKSSPAQTLPAPEADAKPVVVGEPTQAPTVSDRTIVPMDDKVNLDNISDCILAVSLNKGDAYVDDTGVMRMRLTVYDYDRYDMVDIAGLAVGDTILVQGTPVKVETLERDEYGLLHINGGLDADGVTLRTDEDGSFYQVQENDAKAYQELGQVTVRVSADFLYTDESQLGEEPALYYPGDFLTDDGGIDYSFSPWSTKLRMENGSAITMNRVFTP